MTSAKRFAKIIFMIMLVLIPVSGICGCGSVQQEKTEQKEIHVSAAAKASPGSVIFIHGGDYGPIRLGPECSGSEKAPTIIRAAAGEKAVIHAEDGIGIFLENVSNISVEGMEVEGGTHGIYYQSTREAGDPLTDISIRDCTVHGVRGIHGICVYARNDLQPVQDITIEGCEVYDCECGSSESVVLNGNIDGFVIKDNTIHDNNNIGIDMIGFEGTAMHPDEEGGRNAYEADMVRNGICAGNVIYNISAEGNPAYFEDGEYDLCAGGIYVDGGQNSTAPMRTNFSGYRESMYMTM